jgi:hypothetical protein
MALSAAKAWIRKYHVSPFYSSVRLISHLATLPLYYSVLSVKEKVYKKSNAT